MANAKLPENEKRVWGRIPPPKKHCLQTQRCGDNHRSRGCDCHQHGGGQACDLFNTGASRDRDLFNPTMFAAASHSNSLASLWSHQPFLGLLTRRRNRAAKCSMSAFISAKLASAASRLATTTMSSPVGNSSFARRHASRIKRLARLRTTALPTFLLTVIPSRVTPSI
jgi:hypothetical protein